MAEKSQNAEQPRSSTQRPTEFPAPTVPPQSSDLSEEEIRQHWLDWLESVDRDDPRENAIPEPVVSSKRFDIPNNRIGFLFGKQGKKLEYLQRISGAQIKIMQDNYAHPSSVTSPMEIMGTPEQIAKAEQMINESFWEAQRIDCGIDSRFVMTIHDTKVSSLIGKGGERIKGIQDVSGARIQVIPLHKEPWDKSTERMVQIIGTNEQIESAKGLLDEFISGVSRPRTHRMVGGFSQQGYQAQTPTSWGPFWGPQIQQPGYSYVQSGSYGGWLPQYNIGRPPYVSHIPGFQYRMPQTQLDGQQPQQSTSTSSSNAHPSIQSGYPHFQPPPSAYAQAHSGVQHAPPYGYGQVRYGAPWAAQLGYGQAPPPPVHAAHANTSGSKKGGVAKPSPPS